ncbi:MAG: hypothetical protein ABL890_02425 [Candidatus Peribacteraceae bacterium]
MTQFLTYWLWPNPAGWTYSTNSVLLLLSISAALIVLSFLLKGWRRKLATGMTKTLSRSWSSACMWFGILGLFLTVSRVEQIQFLSMRVLWLLWAFCLGLYVLFQFWQFQRRHYTVERMVSAPSEYDRYLPKKKK